MRRSGALQAWSLCSIQKKPSSRGYLGVVPTSFLLPLFFPPSPYFIFTTPVALLFLLLPAFHSAFSLPRFKAQKTERCFCITETGLALGMTCSF